MPSGNQRLYLVDTTLRDGEQRAGLAFSAEQKVACALLMDQAGIDQIEAGIPAMCRQERDAIRIIMRLRRRARIAAWNRMHPDDIRLSLALRPDILYIGVPVSDIQIREKLNKTRGYVLERMKSCIGLAQSGGGEVTVGFEDASRADMEYMIKAAAAARGMGVKRIRYADTVGVAHPAKIARDVRALLETGVTVECHAHNDLGMAVANSLQAAENGAAFVDTTFLGIGERAGNCDFRKFVLAARNRFRFAFSASEENLRELESAVLSTLRLCRSCRRKQA